MARQKKRQDGRYELKVKINGKRYSVYGSSAQECKEKIEQKRKALEEAKAAKFKSSKKMTVSEYFDRWLDAKAGTVKETTIRTDRILLDRIRKTAIDKAGTPFGDLKLVKVEPQNVRDLQKALQNETIAQDKNGKEKKYKKMSTRGVNDALYLLKSVYKAAIADRITEYNPVTVKPLKRTEEPARDTIHRALTIAETTAFMKAAEGSWYYSLYLFLLNTGLRLGEAGALLPGDIVKNNVKVVRTITRTEVGGYMIGEDTKTAAGRRSVPMNAAARKAWEDQKKINALLSGGKIVDLSEPVFHSPQGSLLKSASVNYDIQKCCEAAGIERFTVHAFRDTFATRCVESGMQVKSLQEILGHTDISMTLGLYAHAMDDAKEEQLNAVNFL